MLSAGPAAATNSRGDRGGERQPGRASRLVLAGIVVGLLGVLVLGVAAAPGAAQSNDNVSAPALAYTETAGGTVHLVDEDGNTVDTEVNAKIIGPVADMDQDGTLDVTAVNDDGDIILIPAVSSATETTLVSDATEKDPASRTIAVGDVDGDGTLAVLYSSKNDRDLYSVEPGEGESPQLVYRDEENDTKGALGYGDFNNDRTNETVFRGGSGKIKWVDDNGNVGNTEESNYGSSSGIGLGPLADYDGDRRNRVSAIDGSNVPALINSNGNFTRPDNNYQAASKAPVAAADVTGGGTLEIMHRNANTGTIYYMTTGGASAEYTPGGSDITVSDEQGLSGTGVATRLNATAADYASGPSVTVDRPADGETYSSSDVPLDASADEASDWSYSVDGGANQTATGADGTRTLNTTLSGLSDGQHNVTVYAEDDAGNVGSETVNFTVEASAPTISNFDATNPKDQDVSVSFDSDENLANISVDVSGAETATLTEANFTESGGTYTATYQGSTDGTYNATLETAEDDAGKDGAAGESDNTTIDTAAPSIPADSFNVTNPEGQDVSVNFDSNETLANISVDISGADPGNLTEADFIEDNGTYNATYEGGTDGTYNATLETAEDDAGNDGAAGQSDGTTVDTTAPAVTVDRPVEGEAYASSDVPLNVTADGSVASWNYSLDGGANESFTPNTTLSGLTDGQRNVTVYAEDTDNNVGSKTVNFTVDTAAPSIPTDSFNVTNTEGQNVSVSFDSNETLANISVDISGAENAALTEANFTESDGTYTATYEGNSDGDYNATLETAEDAAGNDGAAGQSDNTTVDTTAPTIADGSFTATNPEEQNVSVSFDSNETLANISVDLAGPENTTLTGDNFTEDNGTYNATYEGDSDGTYNATLETAEDDAGNDAADNQSDNTTVDATAPNISDDSFTTTNPEEQNVSVSFNSTETLTNISVDLAGPENATLTESDFTEDNGTYNATYDGNNDGNYTATLETAEDDAGNDGAAGQSDNTTVDTTAPNVSDNSFTATNPEEQNVLISFDSNESVDNISVDLTGPENATLTEGDFARDGNTYNASYEGDSDGNYTATLETAEDADGNDGAAGQSDNTTVDTTAPTISDDSFNATNPDGQDILVSFDSNESVNNISVDLAGPENATLTESDFTESGGTYNASYEGSTDGTYNATLETAEDDAGNDAADNQSDTTTVDTTAPTIADGSFTATNPEEQNVSVRIDSDENLTDISVNLTGPENATLTGDNFTEDNGTYTATYEGDSDGDYNATLETAEDAAGNDGADDQSDNTTVDTVAPTIPGGSFTVTNPEDQNVSVRIDSDENLTDISVNVSGAENATLTESDFTEDNGTYTATYEGDSDGNYTATLETAEDAAGNNGATGQSNSTIVDTFYFGDESSDGGFADGVDSDPDGEGTVVNAESVSPGASETDRTPEAYVNVSNPEPEQTLLINETGAVVLESGTSVDSNVPENETALADRDANPVDNILPELLLIDTNTSDDFELSVRAYEDDLTPSRTLMSVKPESARADRAEDAEAIRSAAGSFESETDTVAAGYVSINTTLASEEIDGVTFQFSVRQEYLEALGVAPEEVTLYRQVGDDEWEANETTYLGTVGEYYRYETEIPKVTTLALSTGVPTTEVTDASLEQTTIETGEEAVVTATVANRGRPATERTVRLTRDGDTVDTATVELEGNETTTVTLAYTPNSTGEYDLSVESTDLETLTVETEAGPDETEGTGTDGDGPGFGVGVALAALCGAGYALRRRDGPV